MSLGNTKIPYLERIWHPTTGCNGPIGPDGKQHRCPGCWARELVVNRLAGTMKGLPIVGTWGQATDPFAPTFHPDRLADPLRARKPQVIGVSFFGDLFDPGITDEQIAAVFGVMAAAPQHTFVLLTKQAERVERWFATGRADPIWRGRMWEHCFALATSMIGHSVPTPSRIVGPLRNVWTGVSVTNQKDADDRIHRMLRTPAAHRWVSVEPMLGSIRHEWTGIDLVIVGGQSGPEAAPMYPSWVRSIRDQCAAASVPFAFKQWSGLRPVADHMLDGVEHWSIPWMRREG